MGVKRLGLIVAAAVMALSVVGAVSAQSNNPNPNQQWQGNQNCWQQNQQQQNQDCQNDPNSGQWDRGGQGNNGQSDPNWWQHGNHDPHDHRFNGWQPYYNTYVYPTYPGEAVVTPYANTPESITQEAVLRHIVQIVADSLNLQSSDITAQIPGMTLAAIIKAHGGNVTALQTQIATGLTDWLNEIVIDGLITQSSANTVLAEVSGIVTRALNGQFTETGTTVTGLVV